MKYFLDTEFIEDGRQIYPISIGIVADDGREYYAEWAWVPWERASGWVIDNVKPHLMGVGKTKASIAADIIDFVGQQPEFWGYYADYDWVLLCQLYGTMMELPPGWPMFCMDLKQLCVSQGNPRLPAQVEDEHHALADARWVRDSYRWLSDEPRPA